MSILKLSLGTGAMSSVELEPGAPYSYYRVTCDRAHFVNCGSTANVAQDEDNYVQHTGGQEYEITATATEYVLAAIASDPNSPASALPVDDPNAQILTIEKFTPPPPIE